MNSIKNKFKLSIVVLFIGIIFISLLTVGCCGIGNSNKRDITKKFYFSSFYTTHYIYPVESYNNINKESFIEINFSNNSYISSVKFKNSKNSGTFTRDGHFLFCNNSINYFMISEDLIIYFESDYLPDLDLYRYSYTKYTFVR